MTNGQGRHLLGRLIWAACALLLTFSAIGADEAAPVPRPDVKVGDRWRYRVTDYQNNVAKLTGLDTRVAFVAPDLIVNVETGDDGRESDAHFDRDWGASSVGLLGQVFNPPLRMLDFPLRSGQTYPVRYELIAQRGSPARVRAEGNGKVLGWEDVVVPAGKFRALKIEVTVAYQRLDTNIRGWNRLLVWYPPEVKRWAKFSFESGNQAPSDLHLIRTTELTEYKVQ